MKLVLDKPSYLKESINIINELVIEARFDITQTGIELISMDAANIAMINFKLLKNAFTTYDLDKDINLGLNIHNLKDILRRVKESDFLIIEYVDEKLNITLKGKTLRKFKIPIIDLGEEDKQTKAPNLEYDTVIKTTSDLFSDAVDVADLKEDSVGVEITANKEKLLFNSVSNMNESSTTIKASKDTKIECKEEQVAKFQVGYLKKFTNGSKLSNFVTINLKTNFPIKVDYKAVDKVQLSFILAPLVINE